MRCCFNKISVFAPMRPRAFSLTEAVAALAILAIMSSSILVVMNRCMASAANLTSRMQAFEIARENMEQILAMDKVEEMTEFGESEKYPGIDWEVTVEAVSDSVTSRTWVQAVSKAFYIDTEGEEQSIELTHWLSWLSNKQQNELKKRKQQEQELLGEEGREEAESPESEPSKPDEPRERESDGLYDDSLPEELRGKTFDEIWEWLMQSDQY